MSNQIFSTYLKALQGVINQGDAREESFYPCLYTFLKSYANLIGRHNTEVTMLPKATEAGNPDFRIWDGKNHIVGYIEAKKPEQYNLDPIATSDQLKRYLATFPNLLLTNFYEFRLYQHGQYVDSVTIASPINATQMRIAPPLTHADELDALLKRYFSFTLPAITDPKTLARALAIRTRFLRDEIIALELEEEEKQGKKVLLGFYESFKKLLINNLTHQQFADLYAQTLTYGIFAARTRSSGDFNRELIHKYIPNTLGILKSIFKFISLEEPPQALTVLIDDIAEILCVTDIQKILHTYYSEGKGSDPIVHFYETFLSEYDPALREKRGVYYTPEPVVRYIVHAIHSLLKSHFALADGLAAPEVTILDPAAGTLTFPAEAIKTAIAEHQHKYGSGGIHKLIKEHILPHFHAIELMMAPYTVGHLKISYLLAEHGYEMAEDERFKLYLSNTLEPDTPEQIPLPIAQDISGECLLANKVKHQDPILVIMGNPPYSYASENTNSWTHELLKTDKDGAQSYYSLDGLPLGEKNPKGLQDDYVKFLRFAQWKIHKAGKGIVGMITNHGYLENPTFRGMRQSLMQTFDEIYVLDLHGNSLKKETSPDGSKDENVFDIRQGTAVILMIKEDAASCRMIKHQDGVSTIGNPEPATPKVHHHELYGLRQFKYDWLETNQFQTKSYQEIKPSSPFYLFRTEDTVNEKYKEWSSISDLFKEVGVGLYTARDNLNIHYEVHSVKAAMNSFVKMDSETARLAFNLGNDTHDWKIQLAQKDLLNSGLSDANYVPILYRPFDTRYTYYTGKSRGVHCRPRVQTMKHLLKDNLSLIVGRQGLAVGDNQPWNLVFVGCNVIDYNVFYRGGEVIIPLYLYPSDFRESFLDREKREYNISPELLQRFSKQWPDFQPEQLFYYVYAILHSNQYRSRFAQYLRMDFPRIPFPDDYALFYQLAEQGLELAEIHLLKSPRLSPPLAKYQGSGSNDMVDYIRFEESAGIVQINPDKYFEGITPELWNFHIGGYQVLHKYLKDRKGKILADPSHYCRIATALALTREIQQKIDEIFPQIDNLNPARK